MIVIKEYLEVGKIVGIHGLKGFVKIVPWCDDPEFICSLDYLFLDNKEKLEIDNSCVNKNVVLVRFNKIKDLKQAEELIGKILYIYKKDIKLEKNRYFIQDIINLKVLDINNKKYYGKVTEVFKTGANDVYEIINENDKKFLIPVIKDIVKEIDIKSKTIFIEPIKGIFDDEN